MKGSNRSQAINSIPRDIVIECGKDTVPKTLPQHVYIVQAHLTPAFIRFGPFKEPDLADL